VVACSIDRRVVLLDRVVAASGVLSRHPANRVELAPQNIFAFGQVEKYQPEGLLPRLLPFQSEIEYIRPSKVRRQIPRLRR
jgi:hypothetical protein